MRIGFIGLGIMGRPMCKNLLAAGFPVRVFARHAEINAAFEAAGASIATSPADVAREVDVLITMLPNSPDVREVILGPRGVLEGAQPGLTVIDMSSINPLDSREIAAALKERSVDFMDAPVSGGEPKAIDGTLSVMVGGDEAVFEKHRSLLGTMGSSVVRVGEVGAGNTAKLANNMIVAVNIAAVSEALVFAKKAGVDPERVYQAIRGGLAGSTVMDAKAPMMLARDFKPGFRIELHRKDLNNALQVAQSMEVAVPLTDQMMEMLDYLMAHDEGQADHSAIVKYFEAQTGLEL